MVGDRQRGGSLGRGCGSRRRRETKTPAYHGTVLRDQQLAQFLIGKARPRVDASRDTINCAAEFSYQDVERTGGPLSTEAKTRLQLAVSFAA